MGLWRIWASLLTLFGLSAQKHKKVRFYEPQPSWKFTYLLSCQPLLDIYRTPVLMKLLMQPHHPGPHLTKPAPLPTIQSKSSTAVRHTTEPTLRQGGRPNFPELWNSSYKVTP